MTAPPAAYDDPVCCDRCGAEIGFRGHMIPTGRTDPDLHVPIVQLICHACWGTTTERTATR